jgi:hypothetical protein
MSSSGSQLDDLAAGQHGYVTRAQASALGVSDVDLVRLAKRGELKRIDHGVYKFRGAADFRWEPIWVHWLRLDPERSSFDRTRHPDEVVAGRTAAWIYEIGELDPEPYEFIVSSRRQSRRSNTRFRRGALAKDQWEIVDGLPVTRPVKIVADLLDQHVDLGHIEDVAEDALRRGLLSRRELKMLVSTTELSDAFVQRVVEAVDQ